MKREYETEFVVLKGDCQPVLGAKTAVELGLIDINTNKFDRVSLVTKKGENLVKEFHDVFSEDKIGTLPGVQHLKTDEQVLPVIQPSRRISISIRSTLKAELQRMEKQDVIAKVDKPTPWIICPKKNGELRVCLDPREINKALKREHYVMPILDDVLHKLSHSTVFTKLDLK